jgi:hypothetical protein
MSKKIEQKFRLYLRTFYVRTQSFTEEHIFVACVKKRKNFLLIVILEHRILSFLQKPHKMFFAETLYANIECPNVHSTFFQDFFNIYKYVFRQWVYHKLNAIS